VSGPWRVREATYSGRLLIRSAKPPGSPVVFGQTDLKKRMELSEPARRHHGRDMSEP
jgi:hypothetical protein